jgi:hypothetical protein
MKKDQRSKSNAQKAAAPATTLQASSAGAKLSTAGTDSTPRPPEWARYVDSRMKQFCMR